MKIIHYFLGFPPYRSGGLTKYAFDLMKAQSRNGDSVIALWPGSIRVLSRKISIKRHSTIDGISSHEIINPLPVPLDEGIDDIESFMQKCDPEVYVRYLAEINPDVVHIHTLMGLHKEFLDACRYLKIRTVFTSHDYFGLCPKVTMFRNGSICQSALSCEQCANCNTTALSLKKIMILQSGVYRSAKELPLVKKLRKRHRSAYFDESRTDKDVAVGSQSQIRQYKRLQDFYIECYKNVDLIHFNSSVTEKVYKSFFTPKDSVVLPITHSNIDKIKGACVRNPKTEGSVLNILYLAPAKPFKGYTVLKSALDDLWNEGVRNFKLSTYGDINEIPEYMTNNRNGYSYDELGEILRKADLLVAPSVWYETFGFTVLEALSCGVPVLVSDRVGAKDLITDNGIIVEAGNIEALKSAIKSLTPERITKLKNAARKFQYYSWDEFVCKNYDLYRMREGD